MLASNTTPTSFPTVGDFVSVQNFPTVVQAQDIRALRECARTQGSDARAIADFTSGYLDGDPTTRIALERALKALSGTPNQTAGGAFFINGVFGSGKSHLLGVLALLAEGNGQREFARAHPHFKPFLGRLAGKPWLALHIALDEYEAATWSLEAIFWRELELQWRAQFEAEFPFPDPNTSRRDHFDKLFDLLVAQNRIGLVVCWDELSLFLSSRDHQALQADASWLQFLGQRARPRDATSASTCSDDSEKKTDAALCIFAALQKSVDDIGGIAPYSLQQIRDRYATLPLACAQIPTLISQRLLHRKENADWENFTRSEFEILSRDLPRLEFGLDEWRQTFPFHPPVVALLEPIVSRWLSRTRSAVIFCARALDENASAKTRIGVDALWNYLLPELDEHPELRPLGEVWRHWQSDLPNIAQHSSDAPVLEQLMRTLICFKVAGIAPDAIQIANFIALQSGLPDDGVYQWTTVLLERLARRGGHLAIERREGDWADRYTVDVGMRVGEAARRALQNTLETLPTGDERIARFAIDSCRKPEFPLRELDEARLFSVFWQHAPRGVQALLWRSETPGALDWCINRLANLARGGQANAADWLLLLSPPFASDEMSTRDNFGQLSAHFRSHDANFAGNESARVVLWMPRTPTDDEWHIARENAAATLLEDDPQLLDNRRGRAILGVLQSEAPARREGVARIVSRLFGEGELVTGEGQALDAGEMAISSGWTGTLEAIGEWMLPALFPRFTQIAPRARVLTPGNADQICLELLRRPTAAPFFAPGLDRIVRHLAEPLGVARARDGRWQMQAPTSDLKRDMETFLAQNGGQSTLNALEAHFAQSAWGLKSEQWQIAVSAQLRGGDWLALDARGEVLAPSQIGLPLRRQIHALRAGQLLELADWKRLSGLLQVLAPDISLPASPDFAAQEKMRAALENWASEARAECELMRARLHQLNRANPNATWTQTLSALQSVETLIVAIGDGATPQVLEDASQYVNAVWFVAFQSWNEWRELLDTHHAELVSMQMFLHHPSLSVSPELQDSQQKLIERLTLGENALRDATLSPDYVQWRDDYSQQYAAWHDAQNDTAHWQELKSIGHSPLWTIGEYLSQLQFAEFPNPNALREEWQTEMDKRCPRPFDVAASIPICPSCNLRLGQRVLSREAPEFIDKLQESIERLQTLLQNPTLRGRLNDSDWLDWNGESATLHALISPENLKVLDEALRPRRSVSRSHSGLLQVLAHTRTRDEALHTFAMWLDGGQALRGDDEIEWTD